MAGYAIRLETNSYKLELDIVKQSVNFLIKILSMPEDRITKKCWRKLMTVEMENAKYNWCVNIQKILEVSNNINLWQCENPQTVINV